MVGPGWILSAIPQYLLTPGIKAGVVKSLSTCQLFASLSNYTQVSKLSLHSTDVSFATRVTNPAPEAGKMHLILTGGTGLVGTAVLDSMIRTKDVTKISVLSRRPVKFTDDRVNVIIHKDFASYDSNLLAKLEGAEACVWALGISQAQVNKESV